MKKFIWLALGIATVGIMPQNIFANTSTSSSFKVQSDRLVSSGAISKSSSFTVQTKTLTVGIQGKSNSFKIKKTAQETTNTNNGGNNTSGGGTTNNTNNGSNTGNGSNNQNNNDNTTSTSPNQGGGTRTYNPQALIQGQITTDKSIKYQPKTKPTKPQDQAENKNTEKVVAPKNTETENPKTETTKAENTPKTKKQIQKQKSTNSQNANQRQIIKKEPLDLKRNTNTQELTFFENIDALQKTDDPFYASAPKQKHNHNCWWYILLAFLIGFILGAISQEYKHKRHDWWQKIKNFLTKIWKI